MRRSKITEDPKIHEKPVNAGPGKPVHGEIVDGVNTVMEDYLERHNKAYAFMLTLNYPDGGEHPDTNTACRKFLKTFKTDRARHKLDPAYVWVTEKGKNIHHHVAVFLNGNKTMAPHNHLEVAKRIWANTLKRPSADGLVNLCGNNHIRGHLILRGDSAAEADAFHHLSYLAKTRSKDEVPEGVRHWGRTRTR